MKKRLLTTILGICIFSLILATTAYAGWTLGANPVTGTFKAIGAAVYHVAETPALILAGEKSLLKIGDVTRAPIEAIEEIGAGIAGIDTGTVTDLGKMNTAIEKDPVIHFVRNTIGIWVGTAGIVNAAGSGWTSATQAATWSASGVGTATILDYHIDGL